VKLAERIAAKHAGWPGPFVEDEIFGCHDAASVASEFNRFCREQLLAEPMEAVFYEVSVGAVSGLRLADGRGVVVKAHRPNVALEHLNACFEIQKALFERGLPCPRPLLKPCVLADGLATVEELIIDGERRDAHEPVIRRAMAETLARLVSTAEGLAATPGLQWRQGRPDGPHGLWPEPHSRLFDFAATSRGAEWIDEAARRARDILDAGAGTRPVVGHFDWSVKHLRFVGHRARVVYDWDSLGTAEEAVIVGQAARGFTMTWYLEVPIIPSVREARAFVEEYEAASGRRFGPVERQRLGAAATYSLAYTARCEACVGGADGPFPAGSARDALVRHAEAFLEL
jgi:hypothetical protein